MDDAAVVAAAMVFHPCEEKLFSDALELPANRREVFLAVRCGANAGLRARVIALLQAYAAARDFLEEPAGCRRRVPPRS